jgi:flavin reductase (DIM6/NTAB) family NADH-FMN oxidoreductase RutF
MNPNVEEYLAETMRRLEDPGLLLVSKNKSGKNNVMTIGWGLVGPLWGMPMFVIAVRPSRYTHRFIEESQEFTVNVPDQSMCDIVEYCGEVSGREHDKFKECRMKTLKGKIVSVPTIKKCKIHYECRVVHRLEIDPKLVPANVSKSFYPKNNYHTLFFGQILAVY